MPSPYSVAKGEVGVNDKVAVASTIQIVNFTRDIDRVEFLTDGTAVAWVTTDGTDPVVGGNNSIKIPAVGSPITRTVRVKTQGNAVIKFLSAGTPVFSIIEDQG